MNKLQIKEMRRRLDRKICRSDGFTIVEITVVLAVMLTLIGISVYGMSAYRDWQKGSEAGVKLRLVYTAQRTYLADHPTELPKDLTEAKILPYLSGEKAMPKIEDLDGRVLPIDFTVSPPVIDDGSDDGYDPSGKPDDGVWDVGG